MEINELVRRLGNASEKVGKQIKKIAKKEECLKNGKLYLGFEVSEKELANDMKELKEMQKLVEKYENLISYEQNNKIEEVPVIREFLETWANGFLTWAKELRKEYYARNNEYCELWNSRKLTEEQELEYREYCNALPRYIKDHTNLDDMVSKEKKAKYKLLVNRCKAVIGAIIDAKGLKVARNGELNGFIIGTNGKAEVETIGAGGYNIQCFHFRVLVKKVSKAS